MTKLDKKQVFWSTCFALFTGISFLVISEFFQVDTLYGIRENPWLDEVKFAHISAGYFLVFFIGSISKSHVRKKMNNNEVKKRRTGLTLVTTFLLLVLSGNLFFYITSEDYSTFIEYIHIASGLSFSSIFFIHFFKK